MELTITSEYDLHLPDDYQKKPLPGYTKWLEALRSGEYKQGIGKLATKDGYYCCLGVYCKVMDRPAIPSKFRPDLIMFDNNIEVLEPENPGSSTLRHNGSLRPCYLKAIDINGQTCYTLIDANDSGKFNFKDIALVVEHLYCEPPDTTT